jgi:hypothetical protein
MGGDVCEQCERVDRLQVRELAGIVLLVASIGCYAAGVLMWVLLSRDWVAVVTSALVLVSVGVSLQCVAATLLSGRLPPGRRQPRPYR